MKKIIEQNGRVRVRTEIRKPTMAQQQFKDETDATSIVRKYQQTGIWPGRGPGQYCDLSQLPDYQTALNTVIEAQNAFMSLDSRVRGRFQNNPQKLIEFLQDPQNREEAERLGLIVKRDSAANANNKQAPSDSENTVQSTTMGDTLVEPTA